MIGGIIITHGPIGAALKNAAETILGEINNLHEISTIDFSLSCIITNLKEIINKENWDNGCLIMSSLKGGSCWNAAVATNKTMGNIGVVSGVNLPMIISFLTKRDHLPLKELTEIVKQDGIRGIDTIEF